MTAIDDLTTGTPDDAEGWDLPDLREAPSDEIAAADLAWAETMMRRYRAVQARLAKHRALLDAELARHEQEMDRLVRRHREITHDLERRSDYLWDSLAAFALAERTRTGGRVKSVKLLHGSVETTQGAGKWDWDDAALEWARNAAPDLVRVEESFKLADAKRVLKAQDDGSVVHPGTGEVVPGVKVLPAPIRTSISTEPTP